VGSRYGEGFSTFTRWWERVLTEFEKRKELVLVLRPHPLFFGTLLARRIWSQAQIDAFLARCELAGNVLIDRQASYLPLFARADAMLSDASSFVLEFAATGKPLLYLHNPDGPSLNEDGNFVRDHLYWGEADGDLESFLNQVAQGTDPMGPARWAAYPEFMHLPPEGAGAAVKAAILRRLEAELPSSIANLAVST
jgi:CDP-glycerol glycerophosphotransferase (TagB/SpsB family)